MVLVQGLNQLDGLSDEVGAADQRELGRTRYAANLDTVLSRVVGHNRAQTIIRIHGMKSFLKDPAQTGVELRWSEHVQTHPLLNANRT
jgi:hypothetical protein